ncbi:hypothetical protein J3L18_00130 [Mucilaginibacter gossypii]|uniref:hypothetical protein n=1 Tax=Mucilaginibacter gossypii TaxID=551996 RepID=UPI000DCC2814|nr:MULTISPECIES: hypothetical protein [Mucilaginibacter]QTE37510.1 hypothetical protein J3L18_00130 [Mucilaginibacter gossypii]RAV52337.1 hypothetical protein DIU36_24695 [Mucilaginibacter rubeus]
MPEVLENTRKEVTRLISKAKLAKNGGIYVEFTLIEKYLENGEVVLETSGNSTYEGEKLAHPDALHAFDMLRVHLAIICDQREAFEKTLVEVDGDPEIINKFKVLSYSIGGSGDSEGVSLFGSKKISRNRTMNLPAPFTKFMDENDPYEYGDELMATIAHVSDEVNKYLDGKIAPSAQGEFDFEGNDGDENPE